MKKINAGYTSLFEYLAIIRFPFINFFDSLFYPKEYQRIRNKAAPYGRRYHENQLRERHQLIGGFQPLASMVHDVQYTFKPYRSVWEFFKDLLQIVRGVGNSVRGLLILTGTLGFILSNCVLCILKLFFWRQFKNAGMHWKVTTSWLIDGVSSLTRGSTQIVAAPVTLLLRIPFRILLTAIKGPSDILENEEIQRLVKQSKCEDRHMPSLAAISYRLHEEYQKGKSEWQESMLEDEEEADAFSKLTFTGSYDQLLQQKAAYRDYINLFSLETPEEELLSPLSCFRL